MCGPKSDISGPAIAEWFLLYPLHATSAACHDWAYFVSLSRPPYKKPYTKGHISCATAIERVVQHLHGICPGRTRVAILITDTWDPAAYEPWKANFDQIRSHALIEVYLIPPAGVSKIAI